MPRPALGFLPGPGFLLLRRFYLVEIVLGEVAVTDFSVIHAEARIAGRFGAGAEQDHVFVAGIVELIELAGWYGHQHAGIERARRRIGKMKRALALDAVKLLVGSMLVHRSLGSRIIAVHPGVKLVRSKQHFFAVTDVQFRFLIISMNSAAIFFFSCADVIDVFLNAISFRLFALAKFLPRRHAGLDRADIAVAAVAGAADRADDHVVDD